MPCFCCGTYAVSASADAVSSSPIIVSSGASVGNRIGRVGCDPVVDVVPHLIPPSNVVRAEQESIVPHRRTFQAVDHLLPALEHGIDCALIVALLVVSPQLAS